ncbi:hypothetical protein EON66_06240, partial [archaeon]
MDASHEQAAVLQVPTRPASGTSEVLRATVRACSETRHSAQRHAHIRGVSTPQIPAALPMPNPSAHHLTGRGLYCTGDSRFVDTLGDIKIEPPLPDADPAPLRAGAFVAAGEQRTTSGKPPPPSTSLVQSADLRANDAAVAARGRAAGVRIVLRPLHGAVSTGRQHVSGSEPTPGRPMSRMLSGAQLAVGKPQGGFPLPRRWFAGAHMFDGMHSARAASASPSLMPAALPSSPLSPPASGQLLPHRIRRAPASPPNSRCAPRDAAQGSSSTLSSPSPSMRARAEERPRHIVATAQPHLSSSALFHTSERFERSGIAPHASAAQVLWASLVQPERNGSATAGAVTTLFSGTPNLQRVAALMTRSKQLVLHSSKLPDVYADDGTTARFMAEYKRVCSMPAAATRIQAWWRALEYQQSFLALWNSRWQTRRKVLHAWKRLFVAHTFNRIRLLRRVWHALAESAECTRDVRTIIQQLGEKL